MIQALPAFSVSCPSCRSEFPVDPAKVPDRGIHAICSTCLRVFRVERPAEYAELDGPPSDAGEVVGAVAASDFQVDVEPVSDAATDALDAFEDLGGFAERGDVLEVEDASDGVVDASGAIEILEEVDALDAPEPAAPAPPEPAVPTAAGPTAPPATPSAPSTPRGGPAVIVDLSSLAQEAIAEGAGESGKAQLAGSSLSLGAERFRKRGPQERAQRLARVLVSDIMAYYPSRYRESFQRGTLKDDFQDEVRKSWKEYVDQVGQELAESTPYFNEALNEILGQGQQIFRPSDDFR